MKCCEKKDTSSAFGNGQNELQLSKLAQLRIQENKNEGNQIEYGQKIPMQISVDELRQSDSQASEQQVNRRTKTLRPIRIGKSNGKQNSKQQPKKSIIPSDLPAIQPVNKIASSEMKKTVLNPLQIAQINSKYKRPSSQTSKPSQQENNVMQKNSNEWGGRITETDWKINYTGELRRFRNNELITCKFIDRDVLSHNNIRNSIKRDLKERFGTVYDGDEVLVQTLVDNQLQGKQYKAINDVEQLYNVVRPYEGSEDDMTYEALQTSKSKFKNGDTNQNVQSKIQSMYSSIRVSKGENPVSSYYDAKDHDSFDKMREEERRQLMQEFSIGNGQVKSKQALKLEQKLKQELSSSKIQLESPFSTSKAHY